jgi:hypothetical protein
MRYNLRFSVGFLLVALAVAPFVYFHFQSEDVFEYFNRFQFLETFVACVLTLPILLLISLSPAFARLCARDVNRVAETMTTARAASVVVSLVLMLTLVTWAL